MIRKFLKLTFSLLCAAAPATGAMVIPETQAPEIAVRALPDAGRRVEDFESADWALHSSRGAKTRLEPTEGTLGRGAGVAYRFANSGDWISLSKAVAPFDFTEKALVFDLRAADAGPDDWLEVRIHQPD